MRIRLPGYARLNGPGARGVALESCREVLEAILATESLYDFAARQPDAKFFTGRAPVYGITLPDGCGDAVVRRSMRGGPMAKLRTDLFLPPTRGLRELLTSLRLRRAGVSTPEVMAFVAYRAGPFFRRSDVVTREIAGGAHLASVLSGQQTPEERAASWDAAARLLADLARAGAHHPDLNLRNILLTGGETGRAEPSRAHILDVDRIRFHVPGDPLVLRANIDRLERSIKKWRARHGLVVDDLEIAALRARVTELAHASEVARTAELSRAEGVGRTSGITLTPQRNGSASGPSPYPLNRVCIVLMSAVGDAVHALPVINAIKRHHPATHITWVLQPGPATLFRGHPGVDDIVTFHRTHGWRAFAEVRRELSRRQFDLLLDLQVYLKAGLVTALSGSPLRLGFDFGRARDLNWLFTNRRIAARPIRHVQDQFFEFLTELGIPPEPVEWKLGPWNGEIEWQRDWVSRVGRPYAAVVVASSKPVKDWIPERWAQVCDLLENEYGLQPVLVGGDSQREAETAARILAAAKGKPIVALGSGLRRLVSILDASSLVLAPDTGPLHMAVALDRPVISLIAYSDPRRTGPYRKFHDLIIDAFHDPGEVGPVSMETRSDRMQNIQVADVAARLEVWQERYRAKS